MNIGRYRLSKKWLISNHYSTLLPSFPYKYYHYHHMDYIKKTIISIHMELSCYYQQQYVQIITFLLGHAKDLTISLPLGPEGAF
jgi:hypothetical protein